MAEFEYYGDGRPDGSVFIRTATEKGAFFGATPVVQPSGAAQAVACAAALATGTVYGFATVAAASTVINLLNTIRTDLITLGLIKGS